MYNPFNPSVDGIVSGFTKTLNRLDKLVELKSEENDIAAAAIKAGEEIIKENSDEIQRAKNIRQNIEKIFSN